MAAVPDYTYRVTWSPEDGEFVASVAEFPSLSWLAPNPAEAIEGLQALVAGVIHDMSEHGEDVRRLTTGT